MMVIFKGVYIARKALLIGARNTITSAFFALVIATVMGIVIGYILTYSNKYFKFPFRLYVDIIRGTPGLVALFTIYYLVGFLLNKMTGLILSNFLSGVLALAALAGAQVAEMVRGSLQSIPRGQIEAGKAIGLGFNTIFIYILLPQAIVQIIPSWINAVTETIKGSTLLSLIGVTELLLAAHQMVATSGLALAYYTFIGLLYFLINSLIQIFGKYLEKRYSYYIV